MIKYKQIYCDYFGYKQGCDWIPCEVCGTGAVDVHHIDGRGKDKDVIENLMGLCRIHHDQYHNGVGLTKEELQEKHNEFMENFNLMKIL